jgi:putative PIG3 family NAD(P)H quinone oxidoreductase
MRAIVIREPGGPEVLELRDVPAPVPGRGEVRVRVRATAVNRADLLQRKGMYPAPPDCPADIPGLEFAGEIDQVGESVTEVKPGDRVFGLVGGGSYAENLVVHARTVARIPDGMSFVDAAAVPEAFITAYDAMVTQAGLGAGETVVVHAVGSGVGTAAVQIARAIGARSIGTARTREKLERARALGQDESILTDKGRFDDEVLELTGGRGADVILELVGGPYVAQDVQCIAPSGRIVVVGLMGGIRADLDLTTLLRKRITIRGTVLRSRPLEEKIAANIAFERHVVPLLAKKALAPVIDRVMPLDKAAEAHEYVASNEGFGKVVLEL